MSGGRPPIRVDLDQGQQMATSISAAWYDIKGNVKTAVDASLLNGTQAALSRQDSCQPFEVDPEGAVHSLAACIPSSPLEQPSAAKASAPSTIEGLQEVLPKGPAQGMPFAAQLAASRHTSMKQASSPWSQVIILCSHASITFLCCACSWDPQLLAQFKGNNISTSGTCECTISEACTF